MQQAKKGLPFARKVMAILLATVAMLLLPFTAQASDVTSIGE